LKRFDISKIVVESVNENIPIISNLGPTSRELRSIKHRTRNLYQYGSMGLCSSVAFGIALNTDTKVISLDGDGAVIMNMGGLATIGRHQPTNLIVIIYDNEEWGQTAHMPSHTSAGTNLANVSKSCGIDKSFLVKTIEEFDLIFKKALTEDGPYSIVAKIEQGDGPKSPSVYEPEFDLLSFRNTYIQK
jgi:sulfopyruvate decarboxylase subunit beta